MEATAVNVQPSSIRWACGRAPGRACEWTPTRHDTSPVPAAFMTEACQEVPSDFIPISYIYVYVYRNLLYSIKFLAFIYWIPMNTEVHLWYAGTSFMWIAVQLYHGTSCNHFQSDAASRAHVRCTLWVDVRRCCLTCHAVLAGFWIHDSTTDDASCVRS